MTIRDPFVASSRHHDLDRRLADMKQQQKQERLAREKRAAAYKEEDEARERELAQQRETDRRARVDAEEAKLKEHYQMIFLSTPGSRPEQFEREWPQMLRDIQRQRTLEGRNLTEEYIAMMRERVTGAVPE